MGFDASIILSKPLPLSKPAHAAADSVHVADHSRSQVWPSCADANSPDFTLCRVGHRLPNGTSLRPGGRCPLKGWTQGSCDGLV